MSGFCIVSAIVSGVRCMEVAPRLFQTTWTMGRFVFMGTDDTAHVAKTNASRLIIPRISERISPAEERGMNIHHSPVPHDLSLYLA